MVSDINRLIEQTMQAQGIPGLGLAVTRGSDTLLTRGYGVANLEHNVPTTADSAFELASITKLFTATAVMLLHEQGLLSIDDPIGIYLPDLPAAWQPITIRQILAHQSGIRSYTAVDAYWKTTRLDVSRDEILALVADLPLDFAPGERYSYDNTGYYLLGMLIEVVGQQPYAQFLSDTIFTPLGMTSTRANDPYTIVAKRAQGHSRPSDTLQRAEYYSSSGTFSAGVLLSTPADMARWAISLHTDRILSMNAQRRMWTPHPSRSANEREHQFTVGLGWFLVDYQGLHFAGHNGGIVGFSTSLLHLIEQQLTVCVLCNVDDIAEPHAIATAVAKQTLRAAGH
jgi:D-alanyl-D-alanine carboxypeptidase